MEFTAVLEQDPEGAWVIEIPGIPGCYSQGDTREEALANLREVLQLLREEDELPSGTHACQGWLTAERGAVTP